MRNEPHDRQEAHPAESRKPGRQGHQAGHRRGEEEGVAGRQGGGADRQGQAAGCKKGKGNDQLAKPEASDVDLSDLESELEGEPIVVAEADAAKAKPLRMKVSRAKERALMREFGLDETQLTEEESPSAARS